MSGSKRGQVSQEVEATTPGGDPVHQVMTLCGSPTVKGKQDQPNNSEFAKVTKLKLKNEVILVTIFIFKYLKLLLLR